MKIPKSFLLTCAIAGHCQADLVAHWPLDTDATDATGNGHDGAVISGTVNFGQAGANANTGMAASFPDSGHIDVPFDTALNPESFTVALWANAASTDGFASPITSRDDVLGTGTHGYVIYNNSGGAWDFWTGDGDAGWDGLAGDAVTVDTWTHVAITYDMATDTKTLWINGVLSVTDNVPQSGPTQYAQNGTVEMEALHIGSGSDSGEEFYFTGLIDDVAVWNEVLDQAAIQDVMMNGVASERPDPGLSVANSIDLDLDGTVQSFDIPITNNGLTQSLTVSAASFDGDPNFSVTTLPASIAPGGTDNLVISFEPVGSNGLFSGDLEITSNDSINPVRTITLQGAIHDPMLVSDATIDLGESTSGSLMITNDGATRSLNISAVAFSGADADKFTAVADPTLPAIGGTGMIEITFDAGDEEGDFTATLEITSDDPLVPTTLVTVRAFVPFADPLVAWWPLDVDGADASGNGFDGVILGTVVACPGANGATGGSLEFDGASRIDVPFDADLNPRDFTVTLWANASTTDNFASPITSRDDVNGGASTHGYILYNDSGGNWNFWTGDGNSGWDTMPGDAVIVDTWTHVAMTFESGTGTKTLYVDGVQSATETAPDQYSRNGTVEMEALHIGSGQDDGENFRFFGKIDDIGLFRTALSVDDINAIMTNGVGGFTGNARGLEITGIEVAPDSGNVILTFNSVNGAEYIIERSTDLTALSWEELDDSYSSQGEVTTFTDFSVPAGTKKLFYRVIRP